ncbi:MaoC/PaaZ C-terminal domain-containing protein [Brevibacterium marinum]|nr:MaoC/PaaZ C-terminal domain-containing protein [Brevibacterium marinum]
MRSPERNVISTDHSLYYEDLAVGQVYRSSSRTLSEADLTMFSMLSGDWNQVHSDVEYSRADGGQRLLHGVLGIAVVTGLMDKAGWFTSSAIAMTNLDDWNFLQPLHIGDTVTMEMEIVGRRVVSAGDKGIVSREFTLIDQHGEIAQRGRSGMLIKLAA